MHRNIGKNHMILCRHIDHECCYEAKTNGQLLRELLAISFQSPLPPTFKNIGVSKLYSANLSDIDSGSDGHYN